MTTLSLRSTRALLFLLALGVVPACGPAKGPTTPPPAFGGLTSATPTGTPHQVALVWTPATDYSGTGINYNIYYVIGTLPAQSGQEVLQTSVPNPNGVILNLAAADPYVFFVQAQDGSGQTDGNPMSAPFEVQATIP